MSGKTVNIPVDADAYEGVKEIFRRHERLFKSVGINSPDQLCAVWILLSLMGLTAAFRT